MVFVGFLVSLLCQYTKQYGSVWYIWIFRKKESDQPRWVVLKSLRMVFTCYVLLRILLSFVFYGLFSIPAASLHGFCGISYGLWCYFLWFLSYALCLICHFLYFYGISQGLTLNIMKCFLW